MLTSAQVAEFHRKGFLNGGPVLSDAEVDELNAELDRVIAGRGDGQPVRLTNLSGDDATPVWQVVNICDASAAYRRLVFHPRVVEMAAQLIGADALRLWHDQIQYKPPRHGGVNHWHQDGPLWPVLGADSMVSAWLALDDVDETNGCMSLVPGSHRWGPQQEAYLRTVSDFNAIGQGFTAPDGVTVVPELWPVKRGEVSFHHCLTWHGSHGNRSTRPRRAIAIHYMDADTPFVAERDHVMKPFIESAAGEPIRGERFPLVYDAGQVVPH